MANDFLSSFAAQLQLHPNEVAILRASGVRSIEDVDSLVSSFPSLGKAGLRVPLLSAASGKRRSHRFAALSAQISSAPRQFSIVHGAVPPPQAHWKIGAVAPLPPAAASVIAAAPPPAGTIDLRPLNWPVRNQGNYRGTCVAFACAACLEHPRWTANPQDLSEQFLYWAIKTRHDPKPAVDGTFLDYAQAALATEGICAESLCLYNASPIPNNVSQDNPGVMPTSAAIAAAAGNTLAGGTYRSFTTPGAAVNDVLTGLNQGRVVAITVPVFGDPAAPGTQDNWSTPVAWQYGRVLNPPPTASVVGGHAVCITGFAPDSSEPIGGYFIIRNSWGTQWAAAAPAPGNTWSPEPGYGEISATYIDTYAWEVLYY
jgi:hypothetical protein